MKQILFKCKLESDVILTQQSGTSGSMKTLDFIPGSNFYGIVANQLYANEDITPEDKFKLLHTGLVKFGDAHPSSGKWRSLRVPASYYYPKLEGITQSYIHHYVYDLLKNKDDRQKFAEKQLKQCRTGFYLFNHEKKNGTPVETSTSFALKSAYDHNARRSAKSQMYGYESLNAGQKLQFALTYEEKKIPEGEIQKIIECLVGKHRIGKSRTAQYGRVEIQQISETPADITSREVDGEQDVVIYADSRLIFFDEYGIPTFTPTAQDLGFGKEDQILWEKSQIRTFQYAPWNYKRQAFDADRCGIEKGSVIVVHTAASCELSEFVGEYQLEGFGHIYINPDFLEANPVTGEAEYKLQKAEEKKEATPQKVKNPIKDETPLIAFLRKSYNQDCYITSIYEAVSNYIKEDGPMFKKDGENFASQWGNIRSIAMTCSTVEQLEDKLYQTDASYLKHGVAKAKWENKIKSLQEFIDKMKKQMFENDSYIIMAVINLASEMQKTLQQEKKGGTK